MKGLRNIVAIPILEDSIKVIRHYQHNKAFINGAFGLILHRMIMMYERGKYPMSYKNVPKG